MKEVLTVELDRSDIESAIELFLETHGYNMKNVDFSFKHDNYSNSTTVIGAKIIVTKGDDQ